MGFIFNTTQATRFILCVMVCLGILSKELKGEEIKGPGKTFTNSLGMKFVYVSSGSFMMGSGFSPLDLEKRYGGEAKWYNDEWPQIEITLTRPFYMQTTEVTQRQWVTVMGFNPSGFKNCGEDCPVEKVSWNDVQKFIQILNQKEGANQYRLPFEAEWEYACRAESEDAFCFGNEKRTIEDYAWYNANARDWTHQVGQKNPNSWGLYDMHGNVWEWCQDWYGNYPSQSMTNPIGPPSGSHRVSRGGSWRSASRFCRSAHRYGVSPDYRRPTRGFRLVKDP